MIDDPRKQYVAVQQGHDIPLKGLRKPAPQPNLYKGKFSKQTFPKIGGTESHANSLENKHEHFASFQLVLKKIFLYTLSSTSLLLIKPTQIEPRTTPKTTITYLVSVMNTTFRTTFFLFLLIFKLPHFLLYYTNYCFCYRD